MTQQISNVTTTYDGKFHVGMTQKEVYANKELLHLFTFADHNGNKVIDEYEVERYNGPILLENVENKSGRFIGAYSGFMSSGMVAGEIISSKEVEYYPGLKVEQLSERASIHTFREIDVDTNGELSKEELENYKDLIEHNQKLSDFDQDTKNKKDNIAIGLGAGGLLATCVTAIVLDVVAAPLVIGGALTYGAVKLTQHFVDKARGEKRQAIVDEFEQTQASKTDSQYNPAVEVKK